MHPDARRGINLDLPAMKVWMRLIIVHQQRVCPGWPHLAAFSGMVCSATTCPRGFDRLLILSRKLWNST